VAGRIAVRDYVSVSPCGKPFADRGGLIGAMFQQQPPPGEQMIGRGIDQGVQVGEGVGPRRQGCPRLMAQ
jgi:hypothetical protein